MTLSYYVIKYITDEEDFAWPIGIIANDGENTYFRALGVKSPESVDPSPLCRLTGLPKESGWGWLEWVDWFYALVESDGTNIAEFERILAHLQRTGTNITVEPGPGIQVSEREDSVCVVDRLYQETVAAS